MNSFHTTFGYVAAGWSGLIGIVGLLLSRRKSVPKWFYWGVGSAIIALVSQVILGVVLANRGFNPGNQHVFYGVVIIITFTFVYIYRAQFRERPALYYGLLLLFTMGLGIRGILTFGNNF